MVHDFLVAAPRGTKNRTETINVPKMVRDIVQRVSGDPVDIEHISGEGHRGTPLFRTGSA
jgi:hypothetical protein